MTSWMAFLVDFHCLSKVWTYLTGVSVMDLFAHKNCFYFILQVGSKSEANGIAKSGAKMVMAVSCAKVSHLFLCDSF